VKEDERSEEISNEMTSNITLRSIFRIFQKHFISALIAFSVVCALMILYTVMSPKKYTASSELYATYNSVTSNSESVTDINTAGSYISSQIKSYPTLAKTEAVLQPVIDEFSLDSTVDDLGELITVSNPTNTMLVNIEVETTNPEQSQQIANAVAESLSDVVSSTLYSGANSPVKLAVVQKATTPESPSSPNLKMNLAIGVILGLMAGIAAALIRDAMDTKLRTVRDLQDITRSPLLGSVSDNSKLEEPKPIIVRQPTSRTSEEYRRIRTNLSFIAPVSGTTARMIVITSANAAEGKTTTAINLAAALAENGARVLLIDADLRHPSMADRLGIEGNAGLVHVLSGQASVTDVVQQYWKPNFHVMPAGPKPPNASLLLNSKTMEALLEQALKQYDYVIVDTGPMAVTDDAVRFGRLGNGVLLAAGRGVCDKKELRDVVRQFNSVEVPVIGTAMTFAEPPKKHNGNYYYYDTDGKRKQNSHKA
jgi:capsular exopolysaccharide synthesis family protein